MYTYIKFKCIFVQGVRGRAAIHLLDERKEIRCVGMSATRATDAGAKKVFKDAPYASLVVFSGGDRPFRFNGTMVDLLVEEALPKVGRRAYLCFVEHVGMHIL